MTIHENNLEAFNDLDRASRRAAIIKVYQDNGEQTDRGVMTHLGLPERNSTAPEITNMIKAGFLVETGKTQCHITDRTVRTVSLAGEVNIDDIISTRVECILFILKSDKTWEFQTYVIDVGGLPTDAKVASIAGAMHRAINVGVHFEGIFLKTWLTRAEGQVSVKPDMSFRPDRLAIQTNLFGPNGKGI